VANADYIVSQDKHFDILKKKADRSQPFAFLQPDV
jgi:hypothetical protein